MQYRKISADCHLDLPWLPAELFVSEAQRELRDRMPYVEDGPDGPRWTTTSGVNMGLVGGIGSVGGKFIPGQNYRVDKMAETGLYEDGKKGVRRPGDPDQRIKDMDRDGVDAEMIYGILGVASRGHDNEAANEMLRIYNDWLKGFCSHYPDRQIGLACLPYGDIDAAVKEIHRVAKLGLHGPRTVLLVGHGADVASDVGAVVEGRERRAAAAALPHLPDGAARRVGKYPGRVGRSVFFTVVSGFQMNLVNILAAIIAANVLERYPNVRIAFGEAACGWIPYALDRMDFEWEDRFTDLGLKMKPTDYWRRQCKATFQFDRIGAKLIDDMGAKSLMWGSDYPHGDGVWPDSDKYIKEQFAEVSPE